MSASPTTFNVFLDVIRNTYDNLSTGKKRLETINLARQLVDEVQSDATPRIKRHLRLPTLIIHADDEFLPLLLEARETYIHGYFFSCIASAVTTADRICNRLMERYGVLVRERRRITEDQTFGQKIQPLRTRGIITNDQERLLIRLNRIRNRHLHPKQPLRRLTLKRDALQMVRLLHEFLEGTFSVFRDYAVENGRLVPRPLQ